MCHIRRELLLLLHVEHWRVIGAVRVLYIASCLWCHILYDYWHRPDHQAREATASSATAMLMMMSMLMLKMLIERRRTAKNDPIVVIDSHLMHSIAHVRQIVVVLAEAAHFFVSMTMLVALKVPPVNSARRLRQKFESIGGLRWSGRSLPFGVAGFTRPAREKKVSD